MRKQTGRSGRMGILAPMLYRYWYLCLILYDWYQGPELTNMGEMCKADDTCAVYYRWFDMVHCWTYWLSSWLVAEVVIHYLPPLEIKQSSAAAESTADDSSVLDSTISSAPLLERTERNVEDRESAGAVSSPLVVNAIGIMFAVTAAVIAGKLSL
jgi:hypothetical protein